MRSLGAEKKCLRSVRAVALFASAALLFSGGCANSAGNHRHVDEDHDGYCDYDNEPMTQQTRSGGNYYYGNTLRNSGSNELPETTGTGKSSISQGAKGGIGGGSGGAAG